MLNLAFIHEALAEEIPDRACIVFRDRRLSWADVTDRTRRLAAVLRHAGLGCHTPREALRGWESGQDHVALYLHNGNEYLEGMLGAFKARCAPVNVNYRYVDEELLSLFRNAEPRAIVFHARFAPVVERLRPELPGVRVWLQVHDDTGNALLPGAREYEAALADADPAPPTGLSPDDLYILYTGGTTGQPKGVLWRQEDIFRGALWTGRPIAGVADLRERARRGPGLRALPAAPFMHGAAHWVAFNTWHTGGTVVVQSHPEHFDPDDIWSTVERERVGLLTIVGDAFARPLLDQLRARPYDLTNLRAINSGGAILTAALKEQLLAQLPHVRIVDALGSSESGAQASHASTGSTKASTGAFTLAPDSVVLRQDLSGPAEPGSGEIGWLARRGHVPLGYYKDEAKTARTFPVIAGVRYSVPGDRCLLEADGSLRLLGRDAVTINSGGEKIFAEEVEHALKHHPAIYDAVVVGTPSERWGAQVTAVVQLRAGATADEAGFAAEVRRHLATFKLPRSYVYVDRIVRSPSGKADYAWARGVALAVLGDAAR
ncbi:MAG: acyl-CoA synthetase [Candidatus Binatia bacterium]